MASRPRRSATPLLAGAVAALAGVVAIAVALLAVVDGASSADGCTGAGAGAAGSIALGPPGSGQTVGATEYGGPGDPSSGTVGASGASLLAHPDSYAELGGASFQTATAMGGLPYMTALRITWGGRSAVAYKRDIGLGGGPIDGHQRAIDLWWQLAERLGIPYERGRWSGLVRIERPPASGAGELLGGTAAAAPAPWTAAPVPSCSTAAPGLLPITSGPRATLLGDGLASAPASAPAAVRAMLAAGNQLVGKPYVYGGGHGTPLDEVAPAYDCSSSVEHILYAGGLLPVTYDASSSQLESFGVPGPGRWVTLYASSVHVFMYVAGLRWDTHDAAGPGDGSSGIGWHPLVRDAAGFVVRHPVGL
jgi:hypothetical protein